EMRSHAGSFAAQLFKTADHGCPASGSRDKKSRYCIRTKKSVELIGLGSPATSLSAMATEVVPCAPMLAPPVGFESASWKVSVGSTHESSMMGTETVFCVSFAAKVKVSTVVA